MLMLRKLEDQIRFRQLYLYGIRSEARLCREVHLNLAYRWFCRLGLDGRGPDRSTFSKNRFGRFAEGDVLRRVFEPVVARRMDAGIAGGIGAPVDGGTVEADANRDKRGSPDKIADTRTRRNGSPGQCRPPWTTSMQRAHP